MNICYKYLFLNVSIKCQIFIPHHNNLYNTRSNNVSVIMFLTLSPLIHDSR